MQKTAVLYRKSLSGRRPENRDVAPAPRIACLSLPVRELESRERAWIQNCETRMLSPDTIDLRKICLRLLREYLAEQHYELCGEREMKEFFHHVAVAGRRTGGAASDPLRPSTIKTYHSHLAIFFKYLIAEDILTANPMDRIPAPVVRQDQVQPFTAEQIRALLAATKNGFYPKRDKAIILLLLDTGMRAAELCGLKWGKTDIASRKCLVLGKGNKYREVFFSSTTYRAITDYRREETSVTDDLDSPLFYSDRGTRSGSGLSESGLLQLIRRLGKKASIQAVRCSPHTFRHTFALNFLRSGGSAFALKETLGHEDLKMTQKYVRLASADIERQHRAYSPVEYMLKKG